MWTLAWRNLWRHKTRTWLLVLVVAYATLATVAFWGFVDGYADSIANAHARFMTAPVRIAKTDWFVDPDPENALENTDFIAQLQMVSQIRTVAPRVEFPALLRSAYATEGVLARGIEPTLERAVSKVPSKLAQGRWLERSGEAVIGHSLAELLDIRLGERMVIDASALAGPKAKGFRVVGIVNAGVPSVDQGAVLIHIQDARELSGVKTATMLELDVPRGQEMVLARAIQTLLPAEVQAKGVWDLVGEAIRTDVVSGQTMMVPIGIFLALLAALAVTSTVLVSVIERTREFGVIAALGFTSRALARMVALESVMATTLGWLVGLVLGYLLTWYLATHNVIGPSFATYGEQMASTGISEELYTAVRPVYALYSAVVIVLAGLLALLVPARRVLKLKPVEAMRTG